MAERPEAPIALFAHDRPGHLESALAALRRSDGFDRHPLYFFCDAPATPAAAPGAAGVRAVVERWMAERGAVACFRPANLRFRNITDGITQLCASHGRVIVVEDDIVVSPDFLPFMRAALERYESERRVYLVSGFMYAGAQPEEPQTLFLPWAFVWGWATWARAWERYAWKPAGWQELLDDPRRRDRFDLGGGLKYARMLERTMRGEIDTWDIQWSYAVFNDDAVGLYPWRSLTFNTGFGSGVHMAGGSRSREVHGDAEERDFERPRLQRPFVFPPRVAPSEEGMRNLGRRLARPIRGGWPARIRRALGLSPRARG